MQFKNYKFDYFFFIILFISLILKIFVFNSHYISHDGLVNFTTYQYFETILLKNYPNNHIFISIVGTILEKVFGTKLLLFKFVNFLFFILIIYYTKKLFINKIYLYLLFIIFLSSEILFVYSFMLRGYYISAFLFVVIYDNLLKLNKDNNPKKLKTIYLLSVFQVINNISSLYLVLPIVFSTIIYLKKFSILEKSKIFILYFFAPFLFINSIQFLITGAYLNKDNMYPDIYNFVKNFNFIRFYIDGLKQIYFGTYTNIKLFNNLENFVIQINNNKIEFIIIFASMLISFRNIFIKKDLLDYVILYFFVFFLIINKLPPERIYISFLFFFIFYIFENIKLQNLLFKYVLLIIAFIQILNIQNIYKSIPVLKNEQIFIEKILKCDLNIRGLREIEKHLYYFLYLEKCNKDKKLKDFVLFYRR